MISFSIRNQNLYCGLEDRRHTTSRLIHHLRRNWNKIIRDQFNYTGNMDAGEGHILAHCSMYLFKNTNTRTNRTLAQISVSQAASYSSEFQVYLSTTTETGQTCVHNVKPYRGVQPKNNTAIRAVTSGPPRIEVNLTEPLYNEEKALCLNARAKQKLDLMRKRKRVFREVYMQDIQTHTHTGSPVENSPAGSWKAH